MLDEDFFKSLFEMCKVVELSVVVFCVVWLIKVMCVEFVDVLLKLMYNVFYDFVWISVMLKFYCLLLEGSGNFLLVGLWLSFDVGLCWLVNLYVVYGEEG